MRSILILTAGFGEGHNAAARNIQDALLQIDASLPIHLLDPFASAYGPFNTLSQKAYLAAINRTPRLWSLAFNLLDRTPIVEWHIGIYRAAGRILRKTISEQSVGVVVSTYPGCNHLLDHIYRDRLRRPFKTITVVTDSITVNTAWHTARADAFVVANEETRDILAGRGLAPSKLHALGFPVPIVFSDLLHLRPEVPPAADANWKVLAIFNPGETQGESITRAILALPRIDLTAAVGRNASLGRRLTTLAAGLGRPINIVGWSPEMPSLMASHHVVLCKAGGATVQECLAAGTPMIFTRVVPGQEEGNARLVLSKGAGHAGGSVEGVVRGLSEAFAGDGQTCSSWAAAARSLSRPRAASSIASLVLAFAKRG